ncbi:MAG TPA: hypothetical protein EYP48_02375 [Ignisphaera sp.]|uniref:JAB domain-containing protein n=1 Tax=Ignisphaera aggregans TaxID=334771 RepID=A0A832YXC5_9CREN|nr:hypothetical protein [Ignisphaera sp.]HIP56788.1 hypothetical protein [Ignisphaera aggregans]
MILVVNPEIIEDVEKVVINHDKLWKIVPSDVEEVVVLALAKKSGRKLEVLKFISCKNLSSDPSMFIADPSCVIHVLTLCKTMNCVPMIIHSHRVSCMPSEMDRESMKLWNTVWLIISTSRRVVCAWLIEQDAIRRIEIEYTDSQ